MTAGRPLWIAVALVATLAWTAPNAARAASDDPAEQAADFIQSLGVELLEIQAVAGDGAAAARSIALDGLIRHGFDLELTSQLVLGKYWNRASQVHRRAFKELFAGFTCEVFCSNVSAAR